MKRSAEDHYDDFEPVEVAAVTPPLSSGFSPAPSRPASPQKRARSTPPPIQQGPLSFNIAGDLVPKYADPTPSTRPGIRSLVLPENPVRLFGPAGWVRQSNLRTVLSAADHTLLLIFENENDRVGLQLLSLPVVQRLGLLVGHCPPLPGVPVMALEDPLGVLARECRVLDPLGGGRSAAPCLVLVREGQIQATALLGRPFPDIVTQIQSWGIWME